MSLFRQGVMRSNTVSDKPDVQQTLKTLRYKLFAKAAYITNDGRKKIINMAVAMQHREWFEGLWDKSKSFDLPVKFNLSLESSNGKSGLNLNLFEKRDLMALLQGDPPTNH